MTTLEVRDLNVAVDGKEVVHNFSLTIKTGEVHALMGPNGAGKSTLAQVIAGNPAFTVTKGSITLDGQDILALSPDERARKGIFLAFQYPVEVQGVAISAFLFQAWRAKNPQGQPAEFNKLLTESLRTLGLPRETIERPLNVGFSGGEKKRLEMLQLLLLKPSIVLLDETDSGLDIDSLKIIADAINALRHTCAIMLVTHYRRVLEHIKADKVHVLMQGGLAKSGDASLVDELERSGYGWLKEGLKVV